MISRNIPWLRLPFSGPRARKLQSGTRSHRVEAFESRILPTVTATVSKGELRLTGDAGPSDLLIEKDGDQVRVTARNGTNLKVAGSTVTTALFSGVTSLKTSLKGSNDVVEVGHGMTFKNVTLGLGSGANSVRIGGSTITGILSVTGGSGVDNILINGPLVGTMKISTGAGDDRVSLGAMTATGVVTINTGAGIDLVENLLITPTTGGGGGGGGGGLGELIGGVPGLGGLGDLTLLQNVVTYLDQTVLENVGDIVDLGDLQALIDTNGLIDLDALIQLSEVVDLDQILNPNGTINVLALLGLDGMVELDLSSLPLDTLNDLTAFSTIVDLGNLTTLDLQLLQQLIDLSAIVDLDDLLGSDDLADPTQPGGLGSAFTSTLNINTGSQDDIVNLTSSRIGTLKLIGGDGRELVSLKNVLVDRTVNINTGNGDDEIRLEGVQQSANGNNIINAGSGIDVLRLVASSFSGTVTATTGSSGNNQILIDDVQFKSFANFTATGTGDLVKIEQDPQRAGSTTFTQAAKFTFKAAAQMDISQNLASTSTSFLSTVSIKAGTPRAKVKVASARTHFHSPASLTNVDYTTV